MTAPVITFLTDYGLGDAFVGVCHGVIAGICPQARVIDLTHGVPRHDVRSGAIVLAESLPYLPVGVHLAVVDPGVGGARRAVALELADGRRLVGPDNGLLWPAAQAGSGVTAAVEISSSPLRREPVSATFHGRDIFAPVAAHLAAGVPLDRAGAALDPAGLVALELTRARREDGALVARVRALDAFGNLTLDATLADLGPPGPPGPPGAPGGWALELAGGARERVRVVRAFGEVAPGELLLYEDASRHLAVAINQGNAAARLGLGVDDELRIVLS